MNEFVRTIPASPAQIEAATLSIISAIAASYDCTCKVTLLSNGGYELNFDCPDTVSKQQWADLALKVEKTLTGAGFEVA